MPEYPAVPNGFFPGNVTVSGTLINNSYINLPTAITTPPGISGGMIYLLSGGAAMVFRVGSTGTAFEVTPTGITMTAGTVNFPGALVNAGIISANGGTNTSNSTVITTLTPTTALLFTPNATKDTEISFQQNGTAVTVTYGPTTGAEHTLLTAATATGSQFEWHVPAAYKMIVTSALMPLLTIQTV